jgi:glycosyltransferase involved in cell wall biosynthesis
MWENFGPMHVDRCVAVAKHFAGKRKVIGIELGGHSDTYDWERAEPNEFTKITLFPMTSAAKVPAVKRFFVLALTCLSLRKAEFFFCHYESFVIFLVATILRLFGCRVFTMNDSKFDDKERTLIREILKPLFFCPYNAALVASRRAAEYLEFLHFRPKRIVFGYDTISLDRVRREAHALPAPAGASYESRHFTVVARMVPKKNLFTLLEAFAIYARDVQSPRSLHFCGSGPQEEDLQLRAAALGVADLVVFHGSLPSPEVSCILANSLALLLISTEEQFGLVIPEALAMGVPVIVSANCGACDELVRTGVNGFLVEPDNAAGVAYFMRLIAGDKALWLKLAQCALETAPLGDVACFARSVGQLAVVNGHG